MSSRTYGLVLLLCLSLGCTEGLLPDQREVVYFSGLETDRASATSIPDRGPQVSKSQQDVYDPILDGFEKNYPQLLKRPDIKNQIERIESVYVGSGRYLELVSIYQQDFKANGMQSNVIDRLAWGYIRLGMQKQAREVLDMLQEARPRDSDVWFLEGAFWLQWDPDELESQQQFVAAWERALSLDPDYRGFEGIRAADMERQLERVKQRIGPENLISPVERAVDLASEAVLQAPRVALARVKPKPVVPIPDDVEEPPAEALPEGEPAGEETPPAAAEASPEREYKLKVARGELFLSQGEFKKAEDAFIAARTLVPNGFAAEFGQLRAGWGVESARNRVSARARKLAERNDLTARQTYELGLFAYSKMSDRDLARSLWTRTRELDAALAGRVGIDALLKKVE